MSAWIATTAAQRLRLDAGRRGIAEWEREHGELSVEEMDVDRAKAVVQIGRSRPSSITTTRAAARNRAEIRARCASGGWHQVGSLMA